MGNLCSKPMVMENLQSIKPKLVQGFDRLKTLKDNLNLNLTLNRHPAATEEENWPKPDTTVLAQEKAMMEDYQAARKAGYAANDDSALDDSAIDHGNLTFDEDDEDARPSELIDDERPIRWLKAKPIGQGAFGTVYLGFNLETGGFMAVKQVLVAQDPNLTSKVNEHVRALESEITLLKSLSHPNIVRYLGTQRTSDHLHIFLEYVPGGSIASLLAKFGAFHEGVIRVYTRQILEGLHYLHQHHIMHRDVKGANILVDHNGKIKLADFGASKKIESLVTMADGYKTFTGTPYYMAPEVIKQSGYGRSADMWSVGCTVIEMATGKAPWIQFHGHQPLSALFAIASANQGPPVPDHLSDEAKDFLRLIFAMDPRMRPNTARLLKHPFVRNAFPLASPGQFNGQPVGGRTPEESHMRGQDRAFSPMPFGMTPSPVKEEPTIEQRFGASPSRRPPALHVGPVVPPLPLPMLQGNRSPGLDQYPPYDPPSSRRPTAPYAASNASDTARSRADAAPYLPDPPPSHRSPARPSHSQYSAPAPPNVTASTASGVTSGTVIRFGVPGREVEVSTPPDGLYGSTQNGPALSARRAQGPSALMASVTSNPTASDYYSARPVQHPGQMPAPPRSTPSRPASRVPTPPPTDTPETRPHSPLPRPPLDPAAASVQTDLSDPAAMQHRFESRLEAATLMASVQSGPVAPPPPPPLSARYAAVPTAGPRGGPEGIAFDYDCDSVVFRSPDPSLGLRTPMTAGSTGLRPAPGGPTPTPSRLGATAARREEEEGPAIVEGTSPPQTLDLPPTGSADELHILKYVQRKSMRDLDMFRRSLGQSIRNSLATGDGGSLSISAISAIALSGLRRQSNPDEGPTAGTPALLHDIPEEVTSPAASSVPPTPPPLTFGLGFGEAFLPIPEEFDSGYKGEELAAEEEAEEEEDVQWIEPPESGSPTIHPDFLQDASAKTNSAAASLELAAHAPAPLTTPRAPPAWGAPQPPQQQPQKVALVKQSLRDSENNPLPPGSTGAFLKSLQRLVRENKGGGGFLGAPREKEAQWERELDQELEHARKSLQATGPGAGTPEAQAAPPPVPRSMWARENRAPIAPVIASRPMR